MPGPANLLYVAGGRVTAHPQCCRFDATQFEGAMGAPSVDAVLIGYVRLAGRIKRYYGIA